jgi:hypothetical protein
MSRAAVKALHSNPGRLPERAEALRYSQWLEPIYDLNRRMLALLAEPMDEGAQHDFHAGTPIGDVLRDIDASSREQLALSPFLLVDASFRDASRWTPCEHAEAAPPQRTAGTRVVGLARATCVLSWYLLRTDQVAAMLSLGVSQECAAVIARSGLTELQEVAARLVQHRWLKPRWHDRPQVWRRLICLAQATPPKSVAIHGLQLLLGDLLAEQIDR